MKFEIIKKHFLVIILAAFVGAITMLPQLLAVHSMGDKFKGIYRVISNDEPYYLTRAQEIKDGHYFLANTYLAEYKNSAPSQFWLPDYLVAEPLVFFGIDIRQGYIFYDFLLPAILIILTYTIIYLLTGTVFMSLAGAALLHFGFFLEDFNRSPSPQFIFIFWLLLFILLLKCLERPKNIFIILGSINLGLLFYLYPYYWMFYFAFIGVFVIFNLVKNKKFNFLPYLYLAVGAFIIGLPYFFTVFKSLNSPFYGESLARVGMIATHFPSGLKIVLLALIAIFLTVFFLKKKIIVLNQPIIYLLSANLAVAIATNQHVITGKNLEFSSHFLMISEFCFAFLVFYLFWAWLKIIKAEYVSTAKTIFVLLALIMSVLNIKQVVAKQLTLAPEDYYQQNYAAVFDWLNKNTKKDDVVFADGEISNLIPAYTADNVFYSGSAVLSVMSDQEIWRRAIINNYWESIDQNFILNNERVFWGTEYISEYNHNLSKNKIKKLLGIKENLYLKTPPEAINTIVVLAKKIKIEPFTELIGQYKIDYLVWDKNKDTTWRVDGLKLLRLVFEKNNIVIYKIVEK